MCWEVERLVFGTGASDPSGRTLVDVVLYAFDSLYGGSESFCPIDADSVRISEDTTKLFQARQPGSVDILKLFKERMGIPFFIGGIGARGEIAFISEYEFHEKGSVRIRSNENLCVPLHCLT